MPLVIRSLLRQSNTALSFNGTHTLVSTGNLISSNVIASGNVVSSKFIVDALGVSVREIPPSVQSSGYTLTISEQGKMINITPDATSGGTVTVPPGVFNAGQIIRIYNSQISSGNIRILPGSGVTLYTPATYGGAVTLANTGSRNVAPQGIATCMCVALNTFVIHGPGVNSAIG